jgi:hypothetical protein
MGRARLQAQPLETSHAARRASQEDEPDLSEVEAQVETKPHHEPDPGLSSAPKDDALPI